MPKIAIRLALLVGVAASLLTIRGASAQREEPRRFAETGYAIKGAFRSYWEDMGGLKVFGYPISNEAWEVNSADGKQYVTQWFERHRMEYHPELASDPNYYILLGLIGQELYSRSSPVTPNTYLQGNCRPVEGSQVCGRFRVYWDAFGLRFGPNETYRNSLALHGKPISPVIETQIEGKAYQVQWFERARFEWHGPGSVDSQPIGPVSSSYDVLFGLLGRRAIRAEKRVAITSASYDDQQALSQASNGRGALNFAATAPIAAQASGGAAMLLVPASAPPQVAPQDLAANPAQLAGVVIGGLRAGGDLPGIPAGAYAVTLREDGLALRLEGGAGAVVEIPAVISSLALPYDRPATTVAAVPAAAARQSGFNREICYSWGHTQVCGLFAAAVGEGERAAMSGGLSQLRLRPDKVDLSQALPVVAGAGPLDQCARAIAASPPDYSGCQATVLAAPASGARALRPDDAGVDLGVVVAQSAVGEQVYSDAGLTAQAEALPAGAYVAESLVLAGDRRLPSGGTFSRVRLSGPAGSFYLPAIVGVLAGGDPLSGSLSGTAPSRVAVGANLILGDTCFFKVAQCPVDPANLVLPHDQPAPAPLPEPTATPAPSPAPAQGNPFGIASNIASRYPLYESLQTPVDAVAGLGVGWAREDLQFARIEPAKGKFDWGFPDRTVDLLSQRGVQIIGLLNRPTPGWANGQRAENVPPDPQTFAAFAGEVVKRYKDRIHHWQVWNEPDNRAYWAPQADPAAYAALLKATYAAIKAADPSAHVLLGGLVSPSPAVEFLRQLNAAGAWGSFDILALNPYADPFSPEEGQIDVAGVGAARGLADALGQKPIWVTEFGWSTGPADRTDGGGGPVDGATQANYLVRSMALLRAAGAERVLWYTLKDSDPGRNLYGLVGYGQGQASYDPALYKPAYAFFKVLNQQLAGAGAATRIDLVEQRNALDFEQPVSWQVGNQKYGTLSPSGAQVHSGAGAAQLDYAFPGAGNDYVVFNTRAQIAIPDGTSKLGIWVYGDGSSHALKVWLRDSQGEVLQFRLGPAGGPGWHFISAPLGGPAEAISGAQNRRLDFPARLAAIVLDDDPDSASGAGTIYLDDMTASVGAESYAVRFTNGAEVIDVVWAPAAAQLSLPTSSASVTRVRAWGEASAEPAANGRYTFTAGPDPVYIHHVPAR